MPEGAAIGAAIVVDRVSDVSAEAGLIADIPATASRTAKIRVIRIQDSLPCGSEALPQCAKAPSRSANYQNPAESRSIAGIMDIMTGSAPSAAFSQGRQMLVRYRLLLALALTLSPALPGPAIAETAPGPLYQLCAYQLFEPSKALFHARFRDHAIAIMRRHGFDIAAIWAAIWEATRDGKPEFVYLLRWKDEAMMKASWAAFMADPEWIAIKRETVSPDAPIMGGIEDRTMRLMDYSPPFQ
jgi:hypothetical protein